MKALLRNFILREFNLNDYFSVFYIAHVYEKASATEDCGVLQKLLSGLETYKSYLKCYDLQLKNKPLSFKPKGLVQWTESEVQLYGRFNENDFPEAPSDWEDNEFQTLTV